MAQQEVAQGGTEDTEGEEESDLLDMLIGVNDEAQHSLLEDCNMQDDQ
jgi:hypothetical protein